MREARYQIKYQKGDLGHWQNVMKKSLAGLLFDENKLIALEFRRGNAFVCENDRFGIDYAIKNFEKVNAQHEAMMLYSNLPSLLHYEDRNSMAFSIESRVPFLDHRLVEFGFRLRPEFKIRDGMTKWILRESVADALPSKIKNRTDKVAFVTPGESKWLRNELSFLTQIDKASLPFIRFDKAQELLDSFRNGDNRNAKLAWRLAYLNYWVKNFV
jgi:asparagine synthetase B (glutamine-hydrolysing)